MRKLIGTLVVLAAAPLAALAMLLPAAADVNVSPATACVQQSANPHPTDPAGSTTAVLFCATPGPTANTSGSGNGGAGSGNGSNGSGGSGSGGSHGTGTTTAGTTAGGSGTTLASSNGAGTMSGTNGPGVSKSSGKSGQSSNGGVFGGLVSFFSATGGLVFLFALLVLMAIILLAVAVIAWLRGGQEGSWSSRAARLTFRPKN